MLLPRTCPLCGEIGAAPCAGCRHYIGRPYGLVPKVAHVEQAWARCAFDGAGRELVLGLKYGNRRDATAWLGRELADLVEAPFDAVVAVPTTGRRRRQRGFDQADLLARSISRSAGVTSRRLLIRTSGGPQTGLGQTARRVGPAYRLRGRPPDRILLVDDVITTGATLAAAARVLRDGGVRSLCAVAIAYTEPKNDRTTSALRRETIYHRGMFR